MSLFLSSIRTAAASLCLPSPAFTEHGGSTLLPPGRFLIAWYKALTGARNHHRIVRYDGVGDEVVIGAVTDRSRWSQEGSWCNFRCGDRLTMRHLKPSIAGYPLGQIKALH